MTTLNVEYLRKALYIVGLRHDWERGTDVADRTEEIAEEYDRVAAASKLDPRVEEFMRADENTGRPVPLPEPERGPTISTER